MKLHLSHYCILIFCFCLLFSSCKKDSFITSPDARLYINADTLKYDTVFTSTGSITKSFKIINQNDQKLRLSKVKLMGGNASSFKMNVNGSASSEISDLEIAANDSIYIFAVVSINPNTANLPFIISDSILISYNNNQRFVQLQAYGQNANFLSNTTITGNVNWTNAKPYVILGGIRIDTTARLTIPAGCKIYAHANAPFIIDGTLIINGAKNNEAIFTGDRLDNDYKDLPASWPGMYFRNTSKNNVLTYAVIKNAYQAMVVQNPSVNASPKIILHQCIIDNAYDAGVYCINSSLQADNCLIANCGSNIAMIYGGDYMLTHCTVTAYSNAYLTHKNPLLSVSNFAATTSGTLTNTLNATFRNCIFWADTSGFVPSEVVVSKQGGNTFTVLFDKNIYRGSTDPAYSTLTGNMRNTDPSFDSIDIVKHYFDFRITKNSFAPGINKGTITAFTKDLDNRNRNNGLPDLGCYEK